MLREKEIAWFYQEGASYIYPDAWEKYISPIPNSERNNFVSAYYKRLISSNRKIRIEAARSWSIWEASTSRLNQDKNAMATHAFHDDVVAEAFARIECHYFTNKGFFETDNWLLDNAYKITKIPTYIVQGRYDIVCPMISAWELYKKIPNASFNIIQESGHSMLEDGIKKRLIQIMEDI